MDDAFLDRLKQAKDTLFEKGCPFLSAAVATAITELTRLRADNTRMRIRWTQALVERFDGVMSLERAYLKAETEVSRVIETWKRTDGEGVVG